MDMKMIFGIAMFAILATSAFAAEDASAVASNSAGPMMASSVAEAKCRVDFVLAVLKAAAAENIYAQHMATLTQDITHLEQYAQSNDLHAFNGYRGSTYVNHMKDAWGAVKTAKTNRNWTAAEKTTLRSEYNTAQSAFNTCQAGASEDYLKAKIDRYEYILSTYEQKIQLLKGKIDTAGLEALLENAQQEVIVSLKSFASNGNAEGIRNAVGRYCLMDGCQAGVETYVLNFHLEEKYNIEKMGAIMQELQIKTNAANLGTDKGKNIRDNLALMEEHIDNAKNAVDSAGNLELTSEQKKAITGYLTQASGLSKQIIGALGGSG